MSEFVEAGDGLHCVSAPLRFMGVEIGARMSVMRSDSGWLVHSPLPYVKHGPSVAALGEAAWALAPNRFHHLFVGSWADAGIDAWAAPGLEKKRADVRFAGIVGEQKTNFGSDITLHLIRSMPITSEVVVHHAPSRTLVVCDLLFNIQGDASWFTRAALRLGGAYPGPSASLLEHIFMRRDAARGEIRRLLELDFDRVVMAHGAIIESGGKDALRRAYRWLLRDTQALPA